MTVEICQAIGIHMDVIFAPSDVASTIYKPPFLRARVSGDNSGRYQVHELGAVTVKQGWAVDRNRVIDCGARIPFLFGLKISRPGSACPGPGDRPRGRRFVPATCS
ncbi:MAG: hypothetical protein Q6365_018885 [Candidatus Sigynarchaeota archaeon]